MQFPGIHPQPLRLVDQSAMHPFFSLILHSFNGSLKFYTCGACVHFIIRDCMYQQNTVILHKYQSKRVWCYQHISKSCLFK